MSVPVDIAKRLTELAARLAVDTAERNRLIVAANQAGASLREIERVAGITHVAVMKVIRKTQSQRSPAEGRPG